LESLIQRDPEVLIFLTEQASFAKSLARRPGWSSIRGVRGGNFCFIDEADIRRSIMFIDGLAKLHSCLFRQAASAQRQITEPK
jgi:ABC-type Fe3+-hydroxamate transport system substrate-binding protein